VFVFLYAATASYFAGVMVRLMLTLTPIVCIAAAIAFTSLLETYINAKPEEVVVVKAPKKGEPKERKEKTGLRNFQLAISFPVTLVLCMFAWHCTYVTSTAYSSPSVVLATQGRDGSQHIIDDFREAYYWLRQNVIFTN
jgi:dolichyl-diphosphooligosaccharide--protein glycosyltransferase